MPLSDWDAARPNPKPIGLRDGATPYYYNLSRTNWFQFTICTADAHLGEINPDDAERVKEIKQLASHLAKQVEWKAAWAESMILLGELNIFKQESAAFRALTDPGFQLHENLIGPRSNVKQDKIFD